MVFPGDDAHDAGAAHERTALAWQRTALSLVVAAAILGRLTFAQLGWVAITLLGSSLALAVWVLAEARWRYAQGLGVRRRARGRGGRAPMSLALATCLIAVTEIASLFT